MPKKALVVMLVAALAVLGAGIARAADAPKSDKNTNQCGWTNEKFAGFLAGKYGIDLGEAGQKMTPEQISEVEKIVNEKIKEALPVGQVMMPKEEAEKLNAECEFGAKYPDTVSVYFIGRAPTGPLRGDSAFSIEFCGGPHVANTSELGHFKILKEEASSAGVRRIKAVLE